jgi:two-component sensor histidine kinase
MTYAELEFVKASVFCILAGYLWRLSLKEHVRGERLWNYFFVGFALIIAGFLVGMTRDFPAFDRFVVLGGTQYASILKNGILHPIGFICISLAIGKLLPFVDKLRTVETALKDSVLELETKVQERTADLKEMNEQLKMEIDERKKTENQIKASLKEKEVLLREIHHRVKNNLAVIISLLEFRKHYEKEHESQIAFQEIQDRITSMALAHESLYKSETLSKISSSDYLGSLLGHLAGSVEPEETAVTLKKEIKDRWLDLETAVPLGLLLTELVSNCYKHAFPERSSGEIRVSLDAGGDKEFELIVADNGVGIPEHIDSANPQTMGLELVGLLTEQLNGRIDFSGDNRNEVRVLFKEVRKSKRLTFQEN